MGGIGGTRAVVAAVALLLSGPTAAADVSRDRGLLFERPVRYPAGPYGPSELAVGDFNGDGAVDLASIDFLRPRVLVLLADGKGGFGPAKVVRSTAGLRWLTAGDVEDDGDIDIVAGDWGVLDVLTNDGKGRFAVERVRTWEGMGRRQVGGEFSSPRLVDVDADGRLDAVGAGSGRLSAVLNTAEGWRPATLAEGSWRGGDTISVGDVDGDSDPDVVMSGGRRGRVWLMTNDGSGKFRARRVATGVAEAPPPAPPRCDGDVCIGSPAAPVALPTLADIDRDGNLDLLVWQALTPGLTVRHGNGRGGFGPIRRALTSARGLGPPAAVADLDRDGLVDIVPWPMEYPAREIEVIQGKAGGGFLAPESFRAVPKALRGFAVADLDADGDLDVTVTDEYRRSVWVLRNTATR